MPAEFSRTARIVERVFLLGLGVALCAWTWRGWADPLVDYGRELYGAWRLSEGDRLQVDLAWLHGPLSVEIHALLFRLCGPSYSALFAANLAVLVGVLILQRALLRRAFGDWAAAVGSAVFLCICAFGQYGVVGNYTFVAPYSHELTHGYLLSLLGLWIRERQLESQRDAWSFYGGLALGALALTKAEVFSAGAAAVLLCALLELRVPANKWVRTRRLALYCLGVALVIGGTYAYYRSQSTNSLAWHTTLGAFAHWQRADVLQLAFYRQGMGIDAPQANIDRLLRWALVWLGLLLLPALVLAQRRWLGLNRWSCAAPAFLGTFWLLWQSRANPAWRECARALPLFAFLFALAALIESLRAQIVEERLRQNTRASLGCLAFCLLGKILLQARLLHYGFVLALPAALLLIGCMVQALPTYVATKGGPARFMRAYSLALLTALASVHLHWTAEWVAQDRYDLGQGLDRMRVASRGRLAAQALAELEARLGPDDSLLVLPEGVTLNYLARRRSPSAFINFMPPELLLYGEQNMLAQLQRTPPRFVALVHKDTSEYGYPLFGRDYGTLLGNYVASHYRQVALFGDPPLRDGRFGIALLERR